MMIPNKKLFCVIALVFFVLSFSGNANASVAVFRKVVEEVGEFISKLGKSLENNPHSKRPYEITKLPDESGGRGLPEEAKHLDELPVEKELPEETTNKTVQVFHCVLANPTVQESLKKIGEESCKEMVLKALEKGLKDCK